MIVQTKGDADREHALRDIGGDGLFVRGIEQKLLSGEADIAVHSGKDLPYRLADGLVIAGVPAAADPRDCLVFPAGKKMEELKTIGTGSPRREKQLAGILPEAACMPIRGNITTRLRKLREGLVDGIILAMAGIERLQADLTGLKMVPLAIERMLPAACQGILALECRADDEEAVAILKKITDEEAALRFEAERKIFCGMQADCTAVLGAHAHVSGGMLTLHGMFEENKDTVCGRPEELDELAGRLLRSIYVPRGELAAVKPGCVTLVGAGCGKGLITAEGLKAVKKAEVLIFDDLIDPSLTDLADACCIRIYVGKRYGRHSMKQEEISNLLVRWAKAGKQVVRLKGGDSFVFGRGGEEVLALSREEIPFRLIPGVSSSIAVPECAGIPVTHRGVARSFTVVTGRTADGTGEDYRTLASLKGTLVFLMGQHAYPQITAQLIENGKDPATPASVISNGCSEKESRIDGTLADIAAKAAEAPTPAILVVGQTAAFHMKDPAHSLYVPAGDENGREEKQTTAPRRLEEQPSVLVTGTSHFVNKTVCVLRREGLNAQGEITIRLVLQADQIPDDLSGYTWLVFTSANGISFFFDTLRARGTDLRVLGGMKFACIGSGTKEKLMQFGFHADLVPDRYTADALGEALGRCAGPEDRILILRAQAGSPLLTKALDEAGCRYEDRKIYRTCAACEETPEDEACQDGGRYIVFGSASGVNAWFSGKQWKDADIPVCIGKYTCAALPEKLAGQALVAETYTAQGLAEVIGAAIRKG